MPVRIYDISKKLGLENKEVLSKAKALGIAAARVASSSLDKITAEYLEQQLIIEHPNLAGPPAAPATPPPAQPVHEPVVVVHAPPPPEIIIAPAHEVPPAAASAVVPGPEPVRTEVSPPPVQ